MSQEALEAQEAQAEPRRRVRSQPGQSHSPEL